MKTLLLAAAALLCASAAQAGTIAFVVSEDGGAATVIDTGQSVGALGPVVFGDFTIANLTGTTNPLLPAPDLLQANQISIGAQSSASHTLHLTVLANGLSFPTGPVTLNSQFDATGITPGWLVNMSTDINGTTIASAPFSTVGGVSFVNAFTLPGTFFASAHFDITSNGIGSSNTGITLAASPVPGPIVGAGLPGLIAACSGLLVLTRRRRQVAI
jgi:hypothetical protein